jgi:ABC-type polysaccharide/polyol phosphate transport system ATPase subunit
MPASIRVRDLQKIFALAEQGGGPVSLLDALRAGKREVMHREVRALRGISFSIDRGERVGIVGRNGAGKTTLLSILAGIGQPTSGSVEVAGDVHAMLTIGTVLRDEATGRENIYLDGAVHGRSRAEIDTLVDEIVDFAELGDFIERPVRTYSSGMKARLAFAMGAFIKTDILIIDETLAAGDAVFARKASRRMKQLTGDGEIVIVVSHALSAIVDICNRCLWLDSGRLVMDGTPEEVTKAYGASVDQADEAELKQKFGAGDAVARRPEVGGVHQVLLSQGGKYLGASVRAFAPLEIVLQGNLVRPSGIPDLELSLTRVDGKAMWRERLSARNGRLPVGAFAAIVRMDPLILGVNLYRLDATLLDEEGPAARVSRVFEVVDEEGQIGGKPMLYHSPDINVRTTVEAVE